MLKQLVDRLTTAPLVGVDVGSAALKVVELERSGDQVLLRGCAVASLDGQQPAAALKRLLAETGITTRQAALGLASPQVIVKPFQFPTMPRKELRNAIALEAEQAILNGHAVADVAVDWQTLTARSTDAIRGLLSVVPRSVVAARLNVAKEAGLRPSVVDVEGLALWNAYWTLVGVRMTGEKTVLVMNIGARTTNLVIAKGPDWLYLVRDIELGAQAFEKGQDREWADEIQGSLGYARGKGGLRAIDAVYVTGGGSGPNVLSLLKAAVAAPLTFWNPLKQLARDEKSPSIADSAGPLLAVAVGLALRQPA